MRVFKRRARVMYKNIRKVEASAAAAAVAAVFFFPLCFRPKLNRRSFAAKIKVLVYSPHRRVFTFAFIAIQRPDLVRKIYKCARVQHHNVTYNKREYPKNE